MDALGPLEHVAQCIPLLGDPLVVRPDRVPHHRHVRLALDAPRSTALPGGIGDVQFPELHVVQKRGQELPSLVHLRQPRRRDTCVERLDVRGRRERDEHSSPLQPLGKVARLLRQELLRHIDVERADNFIRGEQDRGHPACLLRFNGQRFHERDGVLSARDHDDLARPHGDRRCDDAVGEAVDVPLLGGGRGEGDRYRGDAEGEA